jgi:hypothetical protein
MEEVKEIPMTDAIYDKAGREYEVVTWTSGENLNFKVRDRTTRVGHAYCHVRQTTLKVCDLHIENKCLRPANFFVLWCIPLRWRETNYRNRGIGSALLELIASHARKKGVTRIEGSIKPLDYEADSRLPQWYQDRGFNVVMEPAGSKIIARLSLDLN